MKKTIAIILAMTLAAHAFSVRAQKNDQLFNHLAVGVTAGLDGFGLEVATTIMPIMQLRAGYSYFPFTVTIPAGSLGLNDFDFNGNVIHISDAPMTFGLNSGGPKLLLDVFPGKKTPFHFTVGLLYHNDSYLRASINAHQTLLDAGFADGKMNELYMGLDDADPDYRISPSPDGRITMDLDTWKLRPYVGIGFGRAVKPKQRVGVTFDMGAFFWGKPTFAGYDYSLNPAGNKVMLESSRLRKNESFDDIADEISTVEGIPVFLYMKLNIFVRIF